MGLSIHYKGRFKKDASLAEMVDEVRDIAVVNDWKHHVFETVFVQAEIGKTSHDKNIYGITFSPPGCEPIDITFLSNGGTCSPVHLKLFEDSIEHEDYSYISSKTQYAGFEIHKVIIDLIRYLSKKYFQEFELIDESKYWETGDEKVLRQNFKRYDDMMDLFSDGLENTPVKENETTEDFVIRVARMLGLKRGM